MDLNRFSSCRIQKDTFVSETPRVSVSLWMSALPPRLTKERHCPLYCLFSFHSTNRSPSLVTNLRE